MRPCFSTPAARQRRSRIKTNVATVPEALAIAVQHHQAGRLGTAEELYRQILAVEPSHSDAWHLLGVACAQAGRYQEGVECIQRAIALNPDFPEAHYNLATAFRDQGKLDEAVASFRRALALTPDRPETHYSLGNALREQGKLDEAVACYRRALALRPDVPEAHYNLATTLQDQGELDEAIACYRQALAGKPDYAEAYNNLGNALASQSRLHEAVACYDRAIELRPDWAAIPYNLGNAFRAIGRLADAVACYRRAIERKPDYAEAYNNLGNAFQDQAKIDDAIACYRRALALRPDHAEAHNNLGNAFRLRGDPDEAVACYRRALELKPDCAEAHSNLLYGLSFFPGYDAETIWQEHRRWSRQWAEPLAGAVQPHGNDRSPGRRLRVGYVSPDFRSHAESFFTVPLFSAHDRDNFEIFCYADVLSPDGITERLRSCADVWRSIAGLADEQVAEWIRRDKIDILVDLTMHMARNRLLVFARKPAPVQACWLAYQGTTGLPTMDYRLTDGHVDPPGLFDRCYAEESLRLPDSFGCYDPLATAPAVNDLPARDSGTITFGSFNNFCKVNPEVLRLWARVLKAVHRSRLVMLAPEGVCRRRTVEYLEREGLGPGRLAFVDMQPRPEYLESYRRIDIVLDSFPYNGQTTTLDALWMGVPVVTMVGKTAVGRAGLSLLRTLGTPQWIAETPEQFVSIAAELAGDLPRLGMLRATLRDRLQNSPLMDAPRFARNVEAAYRMMWQRWCAS